MDNVRNLRTIILVFLLVDKLYVVVTTTNDDGVKLPTKCETCKYVALELENRFSETGKSKDVLQLSSPLIKGKTKQYRNSELRLIESLENVCERILQYNMHKEHQDSKRFAKGQSQTMKALHDLVDKGVKVELGIPYELWDSPSVEVTTMKQHCEFILEEYENEIERWYYNRDEEKPSLRKYLCEDRVLKTVKDRECLKDDVDNSKKKGDDGHIVDAKTEENDAKGTDTVRGKTAQQKKQDDSDKAETIKEGRKINRKGDDEL